MQSSTLPRAAVVALFLLLAFVSGRRAFVQGSELPATGTASPEISSMINVHENGDIATAAATIYGRVTTVEGEIYQGRLRFGADEEALWINTFNGFKPENPWIDYVPSDQRPVHRRSVRLFGVELISSNEPMDLGRPLMVRFGDINHIESSLSEIRVSMKSGSVHVLDRFAADDFADGLRVRDEVHGIVELGEWKVRSIEFMSAPSRASDDQMPSTADASASVAPSVPLYGTVHSQAGSFTGFIQWDREACLGSDEFVGFNIDREVRVPFGEIRSIDRRDSDSAALTLRDGNTLVLSGSRHTGHGHRGIYVSDERYGQVLVSWNAFERVEFTSGPAAPSYDDFTAGRPLTGHVTTGSGGRFTGRIVFDLDESEFVETLDAPVAGVDYSILFGHIASIEPGRSSEDTWSVVRLRSGDVLRLDSSGDLGEFNAGVLIFVDGSTHPGYVSWTDVERIDFDDPAD